ncbi:MAG: YheT family hydrolase [Janthinobacterium lividum]
MGLAHTSLDQFQPRQWLANGHLQTIVGNFLPRTDRLPAATTELVPVPLPVEMRAIPEATALDEVLPSKILCHCHWQPDFRAAVTVVLVHGLEGSSHSQYVVGNANKLFAAGCNVVRMNMRNCGGTDALSPTLYHSGLSGDGTALLQWLVARGCTRVVLAGYSMGGNLLLKSAGELGTDAPRALIGVVAVSPPMDLGESADALHHWTNRIYEKRFLRNLLARYRRKVNLFPAVFDANRAAQVASIRDFDEHVMTPYCGFDGASDYYARAGSARVLDRIAVPTLILHALDDPFIRLTSATRAKLRANSNLTLLEPEHGGHCAFLEDPTDSYDGYWAERTLLRFVQARAEVTAQEVALEC